MWPLLAWQMEARNLELEDGEGEMKAVLGEEMTSEQALPKRSTVIVGFPEAATHSVSCASGVSIYQCHSWVKNLDSRNICALHTKGF